MKKIIVALVAVVAAVSSAFAQQQMPPIPLDPQVKAGQLPNGLTYFLRHNEWPEKRVNFYIAQRVGSMQEEEHQRGLAHFLEHMCFNGTTHFPGNSLKTYLENIGVKFGENLNAYTSLDETVYNIDNVNVETPGAIDTCLLILHDWSHDLLLEDKEIDKERGVINEEWRMRSSAMLRMYEYGLPLLYQGSKYGNRLPIGTMDVVMNFPYKDLRDYYKTWYRPDLQAIIIVGDIDVDEMEKKIQTVFADIQPAAADAAERVYFEVPDNKEPVVTVMKDKEQKMSMAYLMWKTEAYPDQMKGDLNYYIYHYVKGALSSMFSDRISEILQKPDAPFLGASFSLDQFLMSKTKDAFSGITYFKDNEQEAAIKALYREILRAKRYGFTASEFERFKSEYLSNLENTYLHRDKVQSKSYVQEYVQLFLNNEPTPGIEWEYNTMKAIVPQIPVEAVNQIFEQMPDTNLVVAYFAPDKEGITYPTTEEIMSYLKAVEAEEIEAFKEEVNNDPLIPAGLEPKPGTVKSIKDDAFGAKLITLSNGIKIHVKQTDYAPNSISFLAQSWGGTSLYPNDIYLNSSSTSMVSVGGLGTFSSTELSKRLAGIQASANPYVGDRSEGIEGSCVKKDFETMLQLVYMCFQEPRRDNDAFASMQQRIKAQLHNQDLDPKTALKDTIASVVYNNDVRAVRSHAEDVDRLSYDEIIRIYKERFANPTDFEYFIIGDCNADSIAPLLAQYFGGAPKAKAEKFKTITKRMAKGEIKNVFEKEQETPTANVSFIYHTPMKSDLRNDLTLSMLEQAMTMLFTETVREDEGGAYGVPLGSGIQDYPEQIAKFQINLPTAPDKRERMTEIIYKGVEDMCQQGPSAENLQKIKEYMLRSHTEALKNNGYWMGNMVNLARMKQNYHDGYDQTVNAITADDIKAMANKIFHSGNRIEVGMTSPVK